MGQHNVLTWSRLRPRDRRRGLSVSLSVRSHAAAYCSALWSAVVVCCGRTVQITRFVVLLQTKFNRRSDFGFDVVCGLVRKRQWIRVRDVWHAWWSHECVVDNVALRRRSRVFCGDIAVVTTQVVMTVLFNIVSNPCSAAGRGPTHVQPLAQPRRQQGGKQPPTASTSASIRKELDPVRLHAKAVDTGRSGVAEPVSEVFNGNGAVRVHSAHPSIHAAGLFVRIR